MGEEESEGGEAGQAGVYRRPARSPARLYATILWRELPNAVETAVEQKVMVSVVNLVRKCAMKWNNHRASPRQAETKIL